jgi:tRNA-dihydrouridine synthase
MISFKIMYQKFWGKPKKPIVGLAPMDGITDEPFRFIIKKYGNPDVIFTEFSNVEGIVRGSMGLLEPYIYNEGERPIVAQMFGKIPQDFYTVSLILCALGFDGIDVNMGCPAKSVASHGAGASLIETPKLAQEIIRSCKKAVYDWVNGREITSLPIPENVLNRVFSMQKNHPIPKRAAIPVSVKTRLGLDKPIVGIWIPQLLEAEPALISLHGRTLVEMFNGQARWDLIEKAANIVHKTRTLILGNGDIELRGEGEEKAIKYGVDGVLIGRASIGNPWIFERKKRSISKEERLKIALEHVRYFTKVKGKGRTCEMKKHLCWYSRGFEGAKDLRIRLMSASCFSEIESILLEF